MMKKLLALTLILIAPLARPAPQVEPGQPEHAVPIEQEPRHRLLFANRHVRLFDVELEPGYQSLWHWHRADGVFVNIATAPTIAQDPGKQPVHRPARAIGETYFIDYGAKPKAHRVSNAGDTPYRVIDTEILEGCGAQDPAQQSTNQSVLVDNARVHVSRVVLPAGESTELHGACGMLVAVSAASLRVETPAGSRVLELGSGGFDWRLQGPSVLTNTGASAFHGVDIRPK